MSSTSMARRMRGVCLRTSRRSLGATATPGFARGTCHEEFESARAELGETLPGSPFLLGWPSFSCWKKNDACRALLSGILTFRPLGTTLCWGGGCHSRGEVLSGGSRGLTDPPYRSLSLPRRSSDNLEKVPRIWEGEGSCSPERTNPSNNGLHNSAHVRPLEELLH